MEIKFLGVGGAFDVAWGNSAAVVRLKDHNYLIDCGNAVFPRLVRTGYAPKINSILITHFHDDHVGSLSIYLAYYNRILKLGKLTVYLPTESFRSELLDLLSHSLGDATRYADFQVLPDALGIQAIDTYDKHIAGMQTWAFAFSDGRESIVYSGDLGDPKVVFEFIKAKKLPNPVVYHEMLFSEHSGHTHFTALHPYLEQYKIYGYHNDPDAKPEDCRVPLVAEHPELWAGPLPLR